MRTIKLFYPGEPLKVITGNGELYIYVGRKDRFGRVFDRIVFNPDRIPGERKVNAVVPVIDVKKGWVEVKMVRLKTVKVPESKNKNLEV